MTNPKHNTGEVELDELRKSFATDVMVLAKYHPIEEVGARAFDNNRATIESLIATRVAEAEKRLIVWAMQAEGLTEPKFVSEPLAVAHRLVERMAQLDPDFAKQLNQGKRS